MHLFCGKGVYTTTKLVRYVHLGEEKGAYIKALSSRRKFSEISE